MTCQQNTFLPAHEERYRAGVTRGGMKPTHRSFVKHHTLFHSPLRYATGSCVRPHQFIARYDPPSAYSNACDELRRSVPKRSQTYSNVPVCTGSYRFVRAGTVSYQNVPVFSGPKIRNRFIGNPLSISALRFVRFARFFMVIWGNLIR